MPNIAQTCAKYRANLQNSRIAGAKVFIEIDPALGASIIGDAPDLPGYSVEV